MTEIAEEPKPHVIDKKIVGYKVVTQEKIPETPPEQDSDESMHEGVARPDVLQGSTYKIKTPQSEHAIYVTINDYILNAGTDKAQRHPYEIFINSKNMEHFQWVLALTRVISAVFRKGGDVKFLVEELKSVFDPRGGYFKPVKGQPSIMMPSLVAELGYILEAHLVIIGAMIKEDLSVQVKEIIAQKREELGVQDGEFPAQAILCIKCNVTALVLMDGCMTCLNCGDSKCS